MTRRSRTHQGLAFAAALTLVTALCAATTESAQADDPLDATCTGTRTVTYTPGIVLLETREVDVAVSATYTCLSTAVSSASSSFTVHGPRSCVAAEGDSVAVTLTWNDGSTSTATYQQTAAYVGGTTVLTKTGSVQSGRFAGDSYLEVVTGPTVSGLLDCLTTEGLTERQATAVLEIG